MCYLALSPFLLIGTCVVLVNRCGWQGLIGPAFIIIILPLSSILGKLIGALQSTIKKVGD